MLTGPGMEMSSSFADIPSITARTVKIINNARLHLHRDPILERESTGEAKSRLKNRTKGNLWKTGPNQMKKLVADGSTMFTGIGQTNGNDSTRLCATTIASALFLLRLNVTGL